MKSHMYDIYEKDNYIRILKKSVESLKINLQKSAVQFDKLEHMSNKQTKKKNQMHYSSIMVIFILTMKYESCGI